MNAATSVTITVHLDGSDWERNLVAECTEGLTADPKWLSPVWFYDEAGSQLFDEITRLEEYYPTRTERSLLVDRGADIVSAAGRPEALVELGSGTSDKTRHLLDAMVATGSLERYLPFDVSEETVRAAAGALVAEYPGLRVEAVIGDFHRHLAEIPDGGRRLVAFLGGTIGNFTPEVRARFLSDLRATLADGDTFLLGVDLVKDPAILIDAYDDAAGVTAAFNRNALRNLNERLGADFDPGRFEHVAVWNEQASWIEMRLRATDSMKVHVDALDLTVAFEEGEEIRTEISAKFTPDAIATELGAAGFSVDATWTAEPGFQLVLARPV